MILYSGVSALPEVLIQGQQELLIIAQTSPCSAEIIIKGYPMRKNNFGQEVKGFSLGSNCFSRRFWVALRIKGRFLIIASFRLTPSQGSRHLPKRKHILSQECHLSLWLGNKKMTAMEVNIMSGSVDYTVLFLFPLPSVPFFVESLDAKFPKFGVFSQRNALQG